jgi:hypothetical protein
MNDGQLSQKGVVAEKRDLTKHKKTKQMEKV